jgi:hypothetical protein
MSRDEYEQRIFRDSRRRNPPQASPPTGDHLSGVAVLAGLFFVVAVVLMASAPWALLQPDQVTSTELNRWFLTVAGSVDAIAAGVLLARALRPRRTHASPVTPGRSGVRPAPRARSSRGRSGFDALWFGSSRHLGVDTR